MPPKSNPEPKVVTGPPRELGSRIEHLKSLLCNIPSSLPENPPDLSYRFYLHGEGLKERGCLGELSHALESRRKRKVQEAAPDSEEPLTKKSKPVVIDLINSDPDTDMDIDSDVPAATSSMSRLSLPSTSSSHIQKPIGNPKQTTLQLKPTTKDEMKRYLTKVAADGMEKRKAPYSKQEKARFLCTIQAFLSGTSPSLNTRMPTGPRKAPWGFYTAASIHANLVFCSYSELRYQSMK
ncbi:hypothetical protein C8R47DRAFT_1082290 [Mycena vitilis]|nr:hypothetical protein C8R47DRAFT_1082290 [Mycena vitilis]